MSERRFFNARDVARMWGEEKARQLGTDVAEAVPLSPETVRSYVRHSRPNKPGQKPHRYADNPAPLPTYLNEGQTTGPGQLRPMIWFPDEGETLEELEQRLRAWFRSRVGPGVGGGRPPKNAIKWVKCPCGCERQVEEGSTCDEYEWEARRR